MRVEYRMLYHSCVEWCEEGWRSCWSLLFCAVGLVCLCCRHRFDDHLVEFSKLTQDRIVGTNNETAHVSSSAASESVSGVVCFCCTE